MTEPKLLFIEIGLRAVRYLNLDYLSSKVVRMLKLLV